MTPTCPDPPHCPHPQELYPLLHLMCGLPEGTDIEVYEEVKWEPTVMVVPVEPK